MQCNLQSFLILEVVGHAAYQVMIAYRVGEQLEILSFFYPVL